MPWLPSNQGRTAAEFPLTFSGGGSIPSYLLQRHDPYAEIIKTLAPAIKDYIREQKADAIANQLMNMEQPPRAEAVDPSIQGPMATAPAMGGADAYKAQKLYQDYISKQQADQSQSTNDYWKNKVYEAQANRYQAEADDPNGSHGRNPRYPITLPDGSTVYVTGNEAARHQERFSDVKALTGKDWSEWNQLAENDLAHIGSDDSGNVVGEFVKKRDKDGNPIAYEKRSIPVEMFKRAQERAKKAAGQPQQSDLPSQGEEPALPSLEQNAVIARAREAIAKGADPAAVKKRLEEAGYDSTGL